VSLGDEAGGFSEDERGRGDGAADEGAADEGASPELVYVGVVVKARGVAGELEVEPAGETIEGLEDGARLFLKVKERSPAEPFILGASRRLGARLGLKLRGVDTPERARTLSGAAILVEVEDLPALAEGQYYHYQIVGMTVVDRDGTELGSIAEVLETGGTDVYVVRGGERELLLPATDEVILEIDLDAGRMTVSVPPGLIE
jgi:16S rRNA processing protein RimM